LKTWHHLQNVCLRFLLRLSEVKYTSCKHYAGCPTLWHIVGDVVAFDLGYSVLERLAVLISTSRGLLVLYVGFTLYHDLKDRLPTNVVPLKRAGRR